MRNMAVLTFRRFQIPIIQPFLQALVLNALSQIGQSKNLPDLSSIFVKATEGLHYFFTASCDLCINKIQEALNLADKTGVHIWDPHLICHGLAGALSKSDWNSFNAFNERIKACLGWARKFDVAYYHCLFSWHAMMQGQSGNRRLACRTRAENDPRYRLCCRRSAHIHRGGHDYALVRKE
jgi:hypothetical protein